MFKDWKKEILTIPNLLSLFRLLLIPVYILVYLKADSQSDLFLAASILAVSCLTDMIDGKIARHFNMISNVGKILDPLADKLTQFSLIVCLISRYKTLFYLVPLFVIKELFQLIAGGISIKNGKMLKGAQLTGKICTTILFVSLIILVMLDNLSPATVQIITIIDSAFLIIAFVDYVLVYFKRESKFQPINEQE